jgi:hypothetical protein
MSISTFERITFEEATRIFYFNFSDNPKVFMQMIEELLNRSTDPWRSVARGWYDNYRDFIADNAKDKN